MERDRLGFVECYGELFVRERRIDRRHDLRVVSQGESGEFVHLEMVVDVEGSVVVVVNGRDASEGDEARNDNDCSSRMREDSGTGCL